MTFGPRLGPAMVLAALALMVSVGSPAASPPAPKSNGLAFRGAATADITFSPRRDMQVPMDRYSIRDLWKHRDLGNYDIPFTAEVQSHEARVFSIRRLSTSPNGRSVSDAAAEQNAT